jgi:hypothetical protein
LGPWQAVRLGRSQFYYGQIGIQPVTKFASRKMATERRKAIQNLGEASATPSPKLLSGALRRRSPRFRQPSRPKPLSRRRLLGLSPSPNPQPLVGRVATLRRREGSKTAQFVATLQRNKGATLAEIMETMARRHSALPLESTVTLSKDNAVSVAGR